MYMTLRQKLLQYGDIRISKKGA